MQLEKVLCLYFFGVDVFVYVFVYLFDKKHKQVKSCGFFNK